MSPTPEFLIKEAREASPKFDGLKTFLGRRLTELGYEPLIEEGKKYLITRKGNDLLVPRLGEVSWYDVLVDALELTACNDRSLDGLLSEFGIKKVEDGGLFANYFFIRPFVDFESPEGVLRRLRFSGRRQTVNEDIAAVAMAGKDDNFFPESRIKCGIVVRPYGNGNRILRIFNDKTFKFGGVDNFIVDPTNSTEILEETIRKYSITSTCALNFVYPV